MSTLLPLLLIPLLLAAPAAAQEDDTAAAREAALARATGGWLLLPDEPYGRVWAAVGPDTEPISPGDALAQLAPGAFEVGSAWRRWAATLARALDAGRPEDRVALALAAAGHGRDDDAWRWLASVGPGAPGSVAGALAYLLPGVPVDTPLGPGGRPGPLADGALLRPIAPPRDPDFPAWQVAWREAKFYGLRVGAAELDGEVRIEGTGSEVRLTPTGGDAASVAVVLPREAGFDVGSRYLDWQVQPADAPLALTLRVAPGDEEHVLWGRFKERSEQRPQLPAPDARVALLELGGLALALDPGDPRAALAEDVAGGLEALLGARVRVVSTAPGAPAAAFAPIVVTIPPGPAGAEKLAWLASMVERHLTRK